jgi:hypothetical protein
MVNDMRNLPKDINPENGNYDVWKNTEEPSTAKCSHRNPMTKNTLVNLY